VRDEFRVTCLLFSHQLRVISGNDPQRPRSGGCGRDFLENKKETLTTHTGLIRRGLDLLNGLFCAVMSWQSPRGSWFPCDSTRPPTHGTSTPSPPPPWPRPSLRFVPFASSPRLLGCPPRPANPNPSSVLSPPATHRNPSLPDRWGGGRSAAWRPRPRRVAGSSSTSSSIPPLVSSAPRPVRLVRPGRVRPRGVSHLASTWFET
jgi:hypothetical protein